MINFSGLEEDYAHLMDIHSIFNSKVDDWIELLDTEKEGDPIYSAAGMPETRYNSDNMDVVRKTSHGGSSNLNKRHISLFHHISTSS